MKEYLLLFDARACELAAGAVDAGHEADRRG
jgi:hypothetical protein